MAENQIIIKKAEPVSLNSGIELPIDGLPASIQRYINAVCDIYHCPREFVTAAVLSTASTAVGKKIKINEGKYKNSLVLWFVLVARSGSNKSYPMKLVTKPLRKIDEELYAEYKKEHDKWKEIPSKERNDNEPRCPSIVLDDCTDERRSEILFINNETDSEAGYGAGNYEGKRGAIGIYPELKGMLRPTFGSELFMTNGLNQRFLFCVVENIEYPKRSHEKLPGDIAAQWNQTIRLLYEGIYHDGMGGHETLFRTTDGEITLSEGADRLYEEYFNTLQDKKDRAGNDYEAAIYSKFQIQVLRYAGIVHALEVAEEKGQRNDYYSLHESTMAYAIRCMEYFERMALLVYHKLVEPPEVKTLSGLTNAEFIPEFFRRYPKVSQNAFAQLTGVSPAYVSKVMKKK